METPYAVPVDDIAKPNANPAQVVVAIPVEETKIDRDPSGILLGKWEAQLCGCCTHCVPNCLMATFCPCISVAQISARLGMTTYTCALLTFVLLFAFTCGFAHVVLFVWIWQLRQMTRERFKIPGGCCEDYCASFWCPCCTLTQIATHVKSYKPGSCDFGPPDTLPAYNIHISWLPRMGRLIVSQQRKMLKWTCSKSPISPQVSAGTTIEFAPEDRHRPETMTKSPPLSPSQKEYDHPYAIEVDSPARPADNETMTKSPTLSPTYKEDDHPYAIEVDPPVTPTGYHHGSPRARDNGVGNIKIGGWETTLCCGCFKHCVPNCCMVTFCPCVTHAQITARLGMASYWCALATLFTLVLLTGGTVHVILFIWIWKARALTRERFQIPGGCCRDCCASLFCPCCTLAQIATHIKSYQPGSCDFGPPDTLPPYSRT